MQSLLRPAGLNLSWLSALLSLSILSNIPLSYALTTDNNSFSPPIDVAVQAPFNRPPFLLELLETAADENPASYYPFLDAIAAGTFAGDATDEQLYTHVQQYLQEQGHLRDDAAVSSFQFALAVHSAAPRVVAHYQFYETSVRPVDRAGADEACEASVWEGFDHHCFTVGGGDVHEELSTSSDQRRHATRQLEFDRADTAVASDKTSTLYVDVLSPRFANVYKEWRESQKEGVVKRLRYKPAPQPSNEPFIINGYGVDLSLKRTDYIVIDDRNRDESVVDKSKDAKDPTIREEAADVKPLSASELSRLGLKAASFVLRSAKPFEALLNISQDFPRYSAELAAEELSNEFLADYSAIIQKGARAGVNQMWINGVEVDSVKIDAFSLLENLRRERQLTSGFAELGFSPSEATSILSSPSITEAQNSDDVQRYDWRDDREGGEVILWLNDLEKDKRYAEWPAPLDAFLQRTYPGQLPSVRRDAHNLIYPCDYTSAKHVAIVLDQLRAFVLRKVPIRVGLVPFGTSDGAVGHAKILYHLNHVYGLSAVIDYLTMAHTDRSLKAPEKRIFDAIVKDRKVRKDREPLDYVDVLTSATFNAAVQHAQEYLQRLAVTSNPPPIFANGAALAQNDEWINSLSQRVALDLRRIQMAVIGGELEQDIWLPSLFLKNAATRRNSLIVPEDEKNVRLTDVVKLYEKHGNVLEKAPLIAVGSSEEVDEPSSSTLLDKIRVILIADLNSEPGRQLILNAFEYSATHGNVEFVLVHSSESSAISQNSLQLLLDGIESISWSSPAIKAFVKAQVKTTLASKLQERASTDLLSFLSALEVQAGQSAVMLAGRVVGLLKSEEIFSSEDFETFVNYERMKRITPVNGALEALGFEERINSPVDGAKLVSLVARASTSDVPEGIFDMAPGPRETHFQEWPTEHSAVLIGDEENAALQIVAAIDPASETSQRWIPILKVLSELASVHVKIILLPVDELDELPIKRFYRYVLESRPQFNEDGAVKDLHAQFLGIPPETLLTMTMDVPPSWLVAPKASVYDLDNIKLSGVKSPEGITALYGLEHILIEGHSRDVTAGVPPRGVQLLLRTDDDAIAAGTIIMANIGYFQFKANPGVYNLALQTGRSSEIFQIDSAGTTGFAEQTGDASTELVLTSFQGLTLFPRLSRKTGMEDEDVLEPSSNAAAALVAKGTDLADELLSKAGVHNADTGAYLSKGMAFGQGLLAKVGLGGSSKDASAGPAHADINIFSVASGHLYERMLNIMMVSVMRHSNSTVKFWFIEQFLSPSFKTSLPQLAEHYGFSYEMVTYKWPHWLRAQREKQRVIWGYKILFLDVLFPLDLDKVIFVDADQIVRTDLLELVNHPLEGAPYGFTPMCDSRTEMEGFRFWKQGYWANFLRGTPYHISALYVVDLRAFRQMAAGDRLRQTYHALSRDPGSLANLDQDLPNHMQMAGLPIHSLPQDWLWCETWCSDAALQSARTIDLCNNPLTKEPKLDRARRQVPEWTVYDEEIGRVLSGKEDGILPPKGRPVVATRETTMSGEGGVTSTRDEQTQHTARQGKDEL